MNQKKYTIIREMWLLSPYARCWEFPFKVKDIGGKIEIKIVNFNPIVLNACCFMSGLNIDDFVDGKYIVTNEHWLRDSD